MARIKKTLMADDTVAKEVEREDGGGEAMEVIKEPIPIDKPVIPVLKEKRPRIRKRYYVDLYRGINIDNTYEFDDEFAARKFAEQCRDEALTRKISRVRAHRTFDDKLIAQYAMAVHMTKTGLKIVNKED